ncbi:MAG: hypothetical protein ACTHUU_04545 [Brachybacterium sp.]
MDLPFVVIVFLALAVLLAVGIMIAVALPHLKGAADDERAARDDADPRHTSRTRR